MEKILAVYGAAQAEYEPLGFFDNDAEGKKIVGIIVDVGTGDGSFAYQLAEANTGRFVIGIDPSHKGLVETARKIYRKPEKGGLPNALFVLASIEDLPEELNGIANQIFINFPWSGLLRSIVLAEPSAWEALRRISQKGAFIDVLFTYDEKDRLALPAADDEYIQNMKERLEGRGLRILIAKPLGAEQLKSYPSTWAKRLSHGQSRQYFYLRIQVV